MMLALKCMNEQDAKSAGMENPGNNHSKAQHSHLSAICVSALGASDTEQVGSSHLPDPGSRRQALPPWELAASESSHSWINLT